MQSIVEGGRKKIKMLILIGVLRTIRRWKKKKKLLKVIIFK